MSVVPVGPGRADGAVGGLADARSGPFPALGLRLAAVLAGAVVLLQVAHPLTPADARAGLTVLTVVVFAAASLTHAVVARGWAWAAGFAAVTVGGGLLAEVVGVATGLPFGSYGYGDALGPRLAEVPLVIPLAWTMMAYPAYVAARHLVPDRRALRVLVAGWALATWDLFLDPQMVGAGYWAFDDPVPALPGVPGIPLGNYLGWLVVALLMMAAVEALGRLAPPPRGPAGRPDAVPLALYLWTYASSMLAAVAFFGNPWAGVWGGVAMGLVAVPLALRLRREGVR